MGATHNKGLKNICDNANYGSSLYPSKFKKEPKMNTFWKTAGLLLILTNNTKKTINKSKNARQK